MHSGIRSIEIDLSELSDLAYEEVASLIDKQQQKIRDAFKRESEMRGTFKMPVPSDIHGYRPVTYADERPTG